jgi:hypothetical protein
MKQMTMPWGRVGLGTVLGPWAERGAAISALVAALGLSGCAGAPPLRQNVPGGELGLSFQPANVQPGRREPGIFVFEDPQSIRVKVRQTSLLSLIDEVAYRRGFNYRVLSDLTPFQIDLHGAVAKPFAGEAPASEWERTTQLEFESERALFDAVVQRTNERYLVGRSQLLAYRWVSDGPEFFLARRDAPDTLVCNDRGDVEPRCDLNQISFKKFFIRNVHVDEAQASLRSLFFKQPEAEADAPPPAINKDNVQNATMVVYKPQNAIVMRSTDASLLDKTSQLLFALDASYQQVLVETLIFQYDESTARRVGVALDYKKETVSADGTRTLSSQITTQFGSFISSSLPTFFFGMSDTERRATLLSKLALNDSDGFVRILAEPRLVLQSGQQASVQLNSTKHVLTSGVNTAGAVTPIETGIVVSIKPTVLGNGKVLLSLVLNQSEFVNTSETGVVLSTVSNRVETSIVAQDGEMVSIGGIHSRRDSRSNSGIPGVREVPGVGALFGSRGGDASRSRIEFMIRPTVERAAQRLRTLQGNIEKTNVLLQRELDTERY